MRGWAPIIVLAGGLAFLASVVWIKDDRGRFDFAGHDPDALSITIHVPGGKRVEGGLGSILVYDSLMVVEPDSLWSDGTHASASLRMSKEQFIPWVHRLGSLRLPGKWATTYSIHTMGDRGPRPSGIEIDKYIDCSPDRAGLEIRSCAAFDGWNHSRHLFIPWEKCSPSLFTVLEGTREEEKLADLLRGIRHHFELNSSDEPSDRQKRHDGRTGP